MSGKFVQNDNTSGAVKRPALHISTDDVDEKFKKKMKQVGNVEKEVETMRFAATIDYPHIDLEKFPVGLGALRLIPEEEAQRLGAVCFYFMQDEVRVGAIDPTNQEVQDLFFAIQERTGAHGALYVLSQNSLDRILKMYANIPVVKMINKDVEIHAEDLEMVQASVSDFGGLQTLLEERTTSDLMIYILGAAFKLDASDVHVEAEEKGIVVRFRLDGILHDAANLPKEQYKKLISRIKLTSSLKLNVTDKPQDGRFTIKEPSGDVDVRVSMMPTVYGESVVMRLLRQSRQGLSLDNLGLVGDAFQKLKKEIERPNGMVITTGPTGSGKTTTMYAVMQILNEPGVKIITLEDPVEYKMEGVNQSQVDITHGYTFAKGLRSILRQDPDIAMVGEIRDLETADIAIQAALTGHLILSTIHTNSAAGAVARFLSMGVKPFLLAPALNCVIGQRLLRKLCEKCKKKITLPEDVAKRVIEIIASMPEVEKIKLKEVSLEFYDAKGCEACNGIGYKGRIGIYEIFTMLPEFEQMILAGEVSEYEIEKLAVEKGMLTMVQDGVLKSLAGTTSVAEVFRVIE